MYNDQNAWQAKWRSDVFQVQWVSHVTCPKGTRYQRAKIFLGVGTLLIRAHAMRNSDHSLQVIKVVCILEEKFYRVHLPWPIFCYTNADARSVFVNQPSCFTITLKLQTNFHQILHIALRYMFNCHQAPC